MNESANCAPPFEHINHNRDYIAITYAHGNYTNHKNLTINHKNLVGVLTHMYMYGNLNEMEGLIYGKVLRETRNLALVRIKYMGLTVYLIVEKENHIEEENHKIYDKFFDGIFGVGDTEEQAFISAYNNDRYAMRDEEIYKEIKELENEENQNEMGNVVYGILLWETKNLALVIIKLNEDLLLYFVIEKPNPILKWYGIVGIGNTEYRAFVSAYKHTRHSHEREEYEEVKELEGMAFGW